MTMSLVVRQDRGLPALALLRSRRGPRAGPRQREEASQRLAKTRDIGAWQATMLRLDAEAELARQPREDRRLAPGEVVAYLRSLPSMWTDAGPEGRRALATALFAKVEVEGFRRMEYELTPEAIELGLNATLPAVLEVGGQIGEFGRGERNSADTSQDGGAHSVPLTILIDAGEARSQLRLFA